MESHQAQYDEVLGGVQLQLEKARRARFGQGSKRGKQIVEQLELAIVDLEEIQAEVEARAAIAAAAIAPGPSRPSSEKRKPARRPLPDHLPRERVVYSCVIGRSSLREWLCGALARKQATPSSRKKTYGIGWSAVVSIA